MLQFLPLLLTVIAITHANYQCTDMAIPSTRTFSSIITYQGNIEAFRDGVNSIMFEDQIMPTLRTNDFVTYQSNFVRILTLDNKGILFVNNGAFNEMFCLKKLSLSNNKINSITNGSFFDLPNLEELYIDRNRIENVPNNCFYSLKSLRIVDLSNNRIKTLQPDSFAQLKNLWSLSLHDNRIQDIPEGTFQDLKGLNQLYLQNNELVSPNKNYFSNLRSLDLLDLSGNGIRRLNVRIFNSIRNITVLKISGNNLLNLDVNELNEVCPKLQKIALTNNLWECGTLRGILFDLWMKDIEIIINNKETLRGKIKVEQVNCIENGTPLVNISTPRTVTEIPEDEEYDLLNFMPGTPLPTSGHGLVDSVQTTLWILGLGFGFLLLGCIGYYKCGNTNPPSRTRTDRRNYANIDDNFPVIPEHFDL